MRASAHAFKDLARAHRREQGGRAKAERRVVKWTHSSGGGGDDDNDGSCHARLFVVPPLDDLFPSLSCALKSRARNSDHSDPQGSAGRLRCLLAARCRVVARARTHANLGSTDCHLASATFARSPRTRCSKRTEARPARATYPAASTRLRVRPAQRSNLRTRDRSGKRLVPISRAHLFIGLLARACVSLLACLLARSPNIAHKDSYFGASRRRLASLSFAMQIYRLRASSESCGARRRERQIFEL